MRNRTAAGPIVWAGAVPLEHGGGGGGGGGFDGGDNKYGCSPPDIGFEYEAILVVERGECSFTEKARHAQKGGYVGLVIINTPGQLMVAPSFEDDASVSIPTVMVDNRERERLHGDFAIK